MIKSAVLKSNQDASVNFVTPTSDGGFFESRFVQRDPDYFIVYLSSHSGCNKSCRFCHLTATGQTTMLPATLEDYSNQADLVLNHYSELVAEGHEGATTVNFNFMARGEPLSNSVVVENFEELNRVLSEKAVKMGLKPQFNISSIVPLDFDLSNLDFLFNTPNTRLYYSLYSMNPKFRKRWVPKAHSPIDVFKAISSLDSKLNDMAVHWAFIAGENDSEATMEEIVSAINEYNINCKFNVVRYNPFSDAQGFESDEITIQRNFNLFVENSTSDSKSKSRIVPRVGFDVKASCGMFICK